MPPDPSTSQALPDRKTSALYARWRRLVDEREDRLSDVPLYSEFLEAEAARLRAALEKLADPDSWDRYKRPHRHTVKFAREALNGGDS